MGTFLGKMTAISDENLSDIFTKNSSELQKKSLVHWCEWTFSSKTSATFDKIERPKAFEIYRAKVFKLVQP